MEALMDPAAARTTRLPIDRILLAGLAAAAAALLAATPSLIMPFPQDLPWYESTALFPRLALGLVVAGAIAEMAMRLRGHVGVEGEELDASASRAWQAAATVALFLAYSFAVPWLGFLSSTALFVVATARLLGLSWRLALALALPLATVLWAVFVLGLKVAFGAGLLV